MNASDYDKSMKKVNMNDLDEIIKVQKRHLYTNDQLIQPSSLALIDNLLPVMEAFLSKCPPFK